MLEDGLEYTQVRKKSRDQSEKCIFCVDHLSPFVQRPYAVFQLACTNMSQMRFSLARFQPAVFTPYYYAAMELPSLSATTGADKATSQPSQLD